jgi:peptide/nickel transport system ATP-binding protein
MKPRLLVCDEITSALDVSVQSAIVDLLRKLKEEGLAMLFITHNLPLVSEIAQTVLIMKDGNIVESGSTHRVLCAPQDAYSRMLLAAAPRMDRMEPCAKDMPAMIAGDTYRD